MAAPTPTAHTFNEGTTSITSSSVSWQTGDVVVVMAGTEGASGEVWSAPTTTGSGLTLAQQQLHVAASNSGGGCWAGQATAGSSGTFSLTDPKAAGHVGMVVWVCSGSAGVGLSSIVASASRTLSFTPSGADGLTIWGVFDWGAGAVQSPTPAATTHSSASPGPQASPNSAIVSGIYSYYFEELDDQVSAGAVSYGIGGTGTGPFTIIAIEVKASGGGGAPAVKPRRVRTDVPIIRAANF